MCLGMALRTLALVAVTLTFAGCGCSPVMMDDAGTDAGEESPDAAVDAGRPGKKKTRQLKVLSVDEKNPYQ